jgi:hypothetical protein
MNVTLCSAFRNATPYLPRYFARIDALDHALHALGHRLTLVWGEGDSTDSTLAVLQAATYRFRAHLVDCTHGGPAFGSIESVARFRQLAQVGNKIWAAIPENTDAVIYVESDLIWQPATLVALLDSLTVYPAVAPMILDSPPLDTFYDVWGFRRNGVRFAKQPPYYPGLTHFRAAGKAIQLDSAGSCLALRWSLAQWLHFPEDCFVGFCRLLYERGGELWLDPTLVCLHP